MTSITNCRHLMRVLIP